jgi:Fe-S-cluster-containing dehydrogenase component
VQACPPTAMVFGDLNDPASQVSRLAGSLRATTLLSEVGTLPKVIYLERESSHGNE